MKRKDTPPLQGLVYPPDGISCKAVPCWQTQHAQLANCHAGSGPTPESRQTISCSWHWHVEQNRQADTGIASTWQALHDDKAGAITAAGQALRSRMAGSCAGWAMQLLLALAAAGLMAAPAAAEQLIYVPVNPNFGGSPLNGPYLMSQAQAGKRYTMPMDDFPDFDSGIVAQTEKTLIFKKNGQYYAYNTDTGTLRLIDFDAASSNPDLDSGVLP